MVLSKHELGIHGRDIRQPEGSVFIPFKAESGMSGIDMPGREIRKGSFDAIRGYMKRMNAVVPGKITDEVKKIGILRGNTAHCNGKQGGHRHHTPEGCAEAGNRSAACGPEKDGNPVCHDNGGQSSYGGIHSRRGRG